MSKFEIERVVGKLLEQDEPSPADMDFGPELSTVNLQDVAVVKDFIASKRKECDPTFLGLGGPGLCLDDVADETMSWAVGPPNNAILARALPDIPEQIKRIDWLMDEIVRGLDVGDGIQYDDDGEEIDEW